MLRIPKRERGRYTYALVLDAAVELFRHGTPTTTQIAEIAHVSVGTVYAYFRDIDDLAAAVLVRRKDELYAAMVATGCTEFAIRALIATDPVAAIALARIGAGAI